MADVPEPICWAGDFVIWFPEWTCLIWDDSFSPLSHRWVVGELYLQAELPELLYPELHRLATITTRVAPFVNAVKSVHKH